MFFKSKERKARELEHKLDNADTNHILHLILSIVTGGLWLPLWLATGLSNVMYRTRLNNELDKVLG